MINNRTVILGLVSCGLLAVLTSCSSPTVKYGDATSAKPISTDFGSNDLQQTVNTMVNSMLVFPPIVELTKTRRPIIEVAKVNNKTMQHIDTQSITDSIRTRLLRSGKFRFTDRSTDSQTIEEVKAQQESGLNDQNSATQFGQQYSAEFLLVSNLSEIKQKNEDVVDVYYKVTMSLKNLKTGILEWSDEQEIRKVLER
ncbi:MAG: penicillin-binding protein activator LpoB [Lentisphaerota bacterium]